MEQYTTSLPKTKDKCRIACTWQSVLLQSSGVNMICCCTCTTSRYIWSCSSREPAHDNMCQASKGLKAFLLCKHQYADKLYATCCTDSDSIQGLRQFRSVPGKRWPQPEGPACYGVPLADALLGAPACLAPAMHNKYISAYSPKPLHTATFLLLMSCKPFIMLCDLLEWR